MYARSRRANLSCTRRCHIHVPADRRAEARSGDRDSTMSARLMSHAQDVRHTHTRTHTFSSYRTSGCRTAHPPAFPPPLPLPHVEGVTSMYPEVPPPSPSLSWMRGAGNKIHTRQQHSPNYFQHTPKNEKLILPAAHMASLQATSAIPHPKTSLHAQIRDAVFVHSSPPLIRRVQHECALTRQTGMRARWQL